MVQINFCTIYFFNNQFKAVARSAHLCGGMGMNMKNLNDVRNEILLCRDFAEVDYYVCRVANAVVKEYAKKHGMFHEVNNPEGLTELTPNMVVGGVLGSEAYYKIMDDGRVHKLEDFQFSYLHGPHDYGVVTHDEWCELPNNYTLYIECVVRELLTGKPYPFSYEQGFPVEEIKEIAKSISI